MSKQGRIWGAGFCGVALVISASLAGAGPDTGGYAGEVLAVDKGAGRIVVGDMGPLLDNGKSEIARRNIQVTPSTQFVKVKRANDTAPTGFGGDYVETPLPSWEIQPGDFVTVAVKPARGVPTALKITVVETK
ncbi:MAG TPA: hypothetical protein VGT40_19790 [Methylomirabilota bacterium]|jgi:hypothetical protein|nr:hypothetical protein [Methylomirabilota bacterium]